MQFRMPPDLKEVGPTVDRIAEALPVSADAVSMCLAEALNNAVIHGTIEGSDNDIVIETSSDTHAVSIRITDHCRKLSHHAIKTVMGDLLAESGRGFPIIMALSQDAYFADGDLIVVFARNTNTTAL